jgi:hypothetical protein
MVKKVAIEFNAYFTDEGKPTCCLNAGKKQVCRFLYTKNFGQEDFCILHGTDIVTNFI